MRIISQDGMADLPYESIGICINFHSKTDIIAYPAATYSPDDEYWRLAHYSSEEKAKKALEMLREECTGISHERRINDLYGRLKYGGKEDIRLFVESLMIKGKYFRFPADDEIEV